MRQNVRHYHTMFEADGINTVYSGPLWAEGIAGLAEALQTRLEHEELPPALSQSIFSVFVEQMNNMLMYSAEKCNKQISKGTFVLGACGRGYFIQTGNVIENTQAASLREKLDYLNNLDEAGLKKHYKTKLRSAREVTAESRGGGLGLIEIARRASSKIEYSIEPHGEGLSFFEMYVTIGEA
jgi:hypothetical protein